MSSKGQILERLGEGAVLRRPLGRHRLFPNNWLMAASVADS